MARRRSKKPLVVKTLTHDEAKRTNIPTAEFQSVMEDEEKSPFRLAYERRNRDLDPQLVRRGKDEHFTWGIPVNGRQRISAGGPNRLCNARIITIDF